ncbi:GDT1-like protein 4 [Striga asiatica]|uniref:GDT1 family protein n=1 Tax=Striga asiatica TaxID=4170 RepID=A0A5A7PKD2_STRAF|nr:GDT1-like protein 4 [Striga asiatica]
MNVLSEIGDKTFFAASILAMRHPRRLVLSGCLSALIVRYISLDLLFEDDELAEVEQELNADLKGGNVGGTKENNKIATIGLAADENPFGVVLGGVLGQALCTAAAVLGGKSLAAKISERMVTLFGGILFIVFGIQSFSFNG